MTWWRGLPTSSSHALIGGVAGAAIATTGSFDVVQWSGLREKVIEPSIYVPLLGFGLAAMLALCLAGRVGRYLDARPAAVARPAARLGRVRGPHARHQRRAEDDGRDRPCDGGERRELHVRGRRLGDLRRRPGDRARHVRRRLADRPHRRPAPVRPRPEGRRRGAVRGGIPAVARGRLRLPDLDHAGDDRGACSAPARRCAGGHALVGGRPGGRGLGDHAPVRRGGRSRLRRDRPAAGRHLLHLRAGGGRRSRACSSSEAPVRRLGGAGAAPRDRRDRDGGRARGAAARSASGARRRWPDTPRPAALSRRWVGSCTFRL